MIPKKLQDTDLEKPLIESISLRKISINETLDDHQRKVLALLLLKNHSEKFGVIKLIQSLLESSKNYILLAWKIFMSF